MPLRKNKRLLFLSVYPKGGSPGQRFRYELFFDDLQKAGCQIETNAFFSARVNAILYQQGKLFKKAFGVLGGLFSCVLMLNKARKADVVFVFREISPIGPAVFEWIIAKVLKKKIIYDFDDAIYLLNYSKENAFFNFLKNPSKVSLICKWAYKISCGNEFLANYARKYNQNVLVLPTVVDTEKEHNIKSDQTKEKLIIGWTGSRTTLRYLKIIEPVLQKLEEHYAFDFHVISDKPAELKLKSLKNIKFNKATEVQDLSKLHIGLMPLKNNQWTEGKCGFKAIQYSALGIAAVVSPYGVNTKIVLDQKTGFLAESQDQWFKAIEKLIKDQALRKQMGEQGIAHVARYYSKKSIQTKFFSLFDS